MKKFTPPFLKDFLISFAKVGGSVAGLCVGVALKHLPQIRSITILERYDAAQLQDQGAGIRVGGEVEAFFKQYASVTVDEYCSPFNAMTFLDTEGKVIISRELPANFATTWAQLFRVLMLAFEKDDQGQSAVCKYRYACNVGEMVEREKKVEVQLRNDVGENEILSADLVIAADGASSRIRQILLPSVKRTYAGYVLLCGLVPVEELSNGTRQVLNESATLCYNQGSQVISYTVPASKTAPPDSSTLLNWGWYEKQTEEELEELMTDVAGKKHAIALPQGGMQEQVADKIRKKARQELAPQFAEAVAKTTAYFVQVITDADPKDNTFWDGKVLLVGDCAAGQRPHAGSAVTQACYHAHLVRLYLGGKVTLDAWSRETRTLSSTLVRTGQEMGSIIFSDSISPGEKARMHFGEIAICQKLIREKWAALFAEDGVWM